MTKSVGPHDTQRLRIPQHQMFVMRVVSIQITTRTGALTHLAEGQFAQAADFAHDGTVECALEQPCLLAIVEIGQLFGLQ